MVLESTNVLQPCFKDVVSFALDHENYDPCRPVFVDAVDSNKSLSLMDVRNRVKRLIAGLEQHGLQPSDTVCLCLMNSTMFPVFGLAVLGIGARLTSSNPSYTTAELAHHLQISNAKFIITSSSVIATVKQAAALNNITDASIFVYLDQTSNHTAHVSTDTLMSCGKKHWLAFDDEDLATTTIASLASTSGTDGPPKMAARSHHNLVTESIAIGDTASCSYKIKRLLSIPFFHAFGAPMVMINALRHGHTTYIMSRFDRPVFLQAIKTHAINETALPPPLILRFLALPFEDRKTLKSIRRVVCGGATLPGDVQNRALDMFAADARIQQVWGMTEGGYISTFPFEMDMTGSVGRLIAGTAKLVDEDNGIVDAPGTLGEFMIRSPTNMIGYYGNPTATRAMFDSEGFMRTGDVGYYSADGKLYIAARKKEMIKVNAFQVSPHELENRLLSIPGIMDAAVIGIPHKDGSELPRAYIVCQPDFSMSEADIKADMSQSLCKYKVMDCEVRRVQTIPKSSTEKILKRDLREAALAETGALA